MTKTIGQRAEQQATWGNKPGRGVSEGEPNDLIAGCVGPSGWQGGKLGATRPEGGGGVLVGGNQTSRWAVGETRLVGEAVRGN